MGKQMSGRKSRFQDLAHVPGEQGHVDKCPTSSIKNFGLGGRPIRLHSRGMI